MGSTYVVLHCAKHDTHLGFCCRVPNRNGGTSLVPSPVFVSGLTLAFLQAEKKTSPCHTADISLPAAAGVPNDAGQQWAKEIRKKGE